MRKQTHGFTYRHGYNISVIGANTLLDSGTLKKANVFSSVQMSEVRNEISWNVLLTGLARVGRSE